MLDLLRVLHTDNNVRLLKKVEKQHTIVAGCLHHTMAILRERLNESAHTTSGVRECCSGVTTLCRISCYERILAYVNANVSSHSDT